MKFKSALGFAALEELTESQLPANDATGDAADKEGEVAAASAAADVVPAADAAPAAVAAPAADAAVAADAAIDAPAADAAAIDTSAAAPAVGEGEAGAGDTASAAGSDDAAAASAADTAAAQVDAVAEPTVNTDEGSSVDPDAEIVEEQMGEIDQVVQKTDDVAEDVEKLEAATESLEGCVAILDAAIQRGGLDIFGASLLRNNVNTVTRSLKVKPLMLPALEDMETPSSKVDGASTAKDGIVAFIKRIIEAIKSAFVRLGEWIVEIYKRLTDAFVAIERRAQKLAERVKTSKMKEGKIEGKALAAKISVEGKPVEDLAGFLTKLGDYAKYLNDPKSYSVYLQAIDLCEQLVKNPEKEEEIRGQISAALAKWSSEMEKHACDITAQARLQSALSGNIGTAKMVKTFYLALLGDQCLVTELPDAAEGIRGMSSTIQPCTTKSSATSVEALDQAAAQKICEVVAAIAKQVRESGEANKGGVKELVGEIKKRKETIIAMVNASAEQISKDAGLGEKSRKVITFINSMLVTSPKLPVHGINRTLPRNLGAALDYVAASIGGAAEAAPAAAAAA